MRRTMFQIDAQLVVDLTPYGAPPNAEVCADSPAVGCYAREAHLAFCSFAGSRWPVGTRSDAQYSCPAVVACVHVCADHAASAHGPRGSRRGADAPGLHSYTVQAGALFGCVRHPLRFARVAVLSSRVRPPAAEVLRSDG